MHHFEQLDQLRWLSSERLEKHLRHQVLVAVRVAGECVSFVYLGNQMQEVWDSPVLQLVMSTGPQISSFSRLQKLVFTGE